MLELLNGMVLGDNRLRLLLLYHIPSTQNHAARALVPHCTVESVLQSPQAHISGKV